MANVPEQNISCLYSTCLKFGWDITRVGPSEDADLYSQAKAFSASVDAGEVKVKHDDESVDDGEKTPY